MTMSSESSSFKGNPPLPPILKQNIETVAPAIDGRSIEPTGVGIVKQVPVNKLESGEIGRGITTVCKHVEFNNWVFYFDLKGVRVSHVTL